MWTSSFFFGNFLGPTLSGILVDKFGFRSTTRGFFVMFSLNIVVDTMMLFINMHNSKNKSMTSGYKKLSNVEI